MDLETGKTIVDIVQAVITTAAIITAGIWGYILFVRQRQRYPQAKLEHHVSLVKLLPERVLVRVSVDVTNTGKVLIQLQSAKIWIHGICPLDHLMTERISPPKPDYDKLYQNGAGEISWPELDSHEREWQRGQLEIEPNEQHQLRYDFIISEKVETIQIYSFIQNRAKEKKKLGWDLATIHKITTI